MKIAEAPTWKDCRHDITCCFKSSLKVLGFTLAVVQPDQSSRRRKGREDGEAEEKPKTPNKKMMEDGDEEKTLGMRFCSECNNMLYPRENRKEKILEFKCRHCDNREQVHTVQECTVYRNDIKASKDIQWSNIECSELTKDPTLPRTRGSTCPNCGNDEVVFLQTGFGIIKENQGGMNLWLICTRCNHHFKNQQ